MPAKNLMIVVYVLATLVLYWHSGIELIEQLKVSNKIVLLETAFNISTILDHFGDKIYTQTLKYNNLQLDY